MSGGDLLAPETMGIRKNFLVVRTILVYSYVGVATDVADEDSMPGSSKEMVADFVHVPVGSLLSITSRVVLEVERVQTQQVCCNGTYILSNGCGLTSRLHINAGNVLGRQFQSLSQGVQDLIYSNFSRIACSENFLVFLLSMAASSSLVFPI
jgi:hypothetical protein